MNRGEVGSLGESITASFLVKHGFSIVDRNFHRRWGEIDIIAKDKGEKLHFVEVKSVLSKIADVPRETAYRPEENVHPMKARRLARTIQTYLLESGWEGEWQFDVAAVFIDAENRRAKVRLLKDIIIGS